MTTHAIASGMLLLLASALSSAAGSKLSEMPWACINVAGESHAVRLADSGRLRAAGFQHVPEQATRGEAIYFVYEPPRRPSFHMHNVAVPLTLAWIAPDNRVLDVIGIEPNSSGHRPSERVRAVLELSPGHPLLSRIKAGVRISPPRRQANADGASPCFGNGKNGAPWQRDLEEHGRRRKGNGLSLRLCNRAGRKRAGRHRGPGAP